MSNPAFVAVRGGEVISHGDDRETMIRNKTDYLDRFAVIPWVEADPRAIGRYCARTGYRFDDYPDGVLIAAARSSR